MPYPALTAHRFAYDVDGTIMLYRSRTASFTTLSEAQKNSMNDEDTDGYTIELMQDPNNEAHLIWVFPELRVVSQWAGFFVYNVATLYVDYSTDTTTGQDGTWTAVGTIGPQMVAVQPYVRSQINAITVNSGNAVKGIRLRYVHATTTDYNPVVYYWHWFGTKNSHAGLAFWDPSSDAHAAPTFLDFGDLSQGNVATKTFRIKNHHSTQTANGIVVSAADQSGTMDLEFSIGGGAYSTDLNIGNLAAGATSGVITARRTVPSSEAIRIQAARVSAIPTSWS